MKNKRNVESISEENEGGKPYKENSGIFKVSEGIYKLKHRSTIWKTQEDPIWQNCINISYT